MAAFDIIVNPPQHYHAQSYAMDDQYYSIDTAARATVKSWLDFNGHILVNAFIGEDVIGYYNLMPLTEECGKLFERQAIKEEDLRPEHILPHEALPHAQYAYLASIAVRNTTDYVNHQCVAAMLSIMASHLLNGFQEKKFEEAFCQPDDVSWKSHGAAFGFAPCEGHA